MYTSVMLLALSGYAAPMGAAPESPSWLDDYAQAREEGERHKKPLAVFFGSGQAGWDQVSKDGKLGREVRDVLGSDYVCVYVDTSKESGKELASTFEIQDSKGLVISDRGGKLQAFRHQGKLAGEDLQRYLTKYADPEHVARTTESTVREDIRYYPPASSPAPAQPYTPAFSGFSSGRSC
jgi:hypothetical protein